MKLFGKLDQHLLERLEKNGVYSQKKRGHIIGSSEARMILRLPKEVMNPIIKGWEERGLAKQKQGSLLISSYWREQEGLRLNSRSRK